MPNQGMGGYARINTRLVRKGKAFGLNIGDKIALTIESCSKGINGKILWQNSINRPKIPIAFSDHLSKKESTTNPKPIAAITSKSKV
jgi:hypothetical protein